MSTIRLNRRAISICAQVGLLLVVFALLGGCVGDRPPLAPERTWEEVRYHRSESLSGEGFRDMTVDASGEMILNLQGQRAPTRGLLAGENLETLARLIDALPSAGYQASNGAAVFFVSLRIGGEVRDYAVGADDSEAPAALAAIASQFDRWVEETRESRRVVIPFRVLAEGTYSSIQTESCEPIHGRDELLALWSRIGPNGPAVLPAVDFARETVVGIFLGARATGGYGISVDVTYRTQTGQIVIKESRTEPGAGCGVTMARSAPYILIAIGTPKTGDFLIESTTTVTICSPAATPEGR
jgi:hypothetical protein